jgi:hypothetical protein
VSDEIIGVRTNKMQCSWCGHEVDAHVSQDELFNAIKHAPADGDVSICTYCGKINMFENNLLRKPTEQELEIIENDPDLFPMKKFAANLYSQIITGS